MLGCKGWDSGNFPWLEPNCDQRMDFSSNVPKFVVDLEEIRGLEKNSNKKNSSIKIWIVLLLKTYTV